MFYDDDLDVFVGDGDFGVSITYTPDGGSPSTIIGQFFNEYESVNVVGSDAESQIPMVIVKESDVPDLAHGDLFVINGTNYYAREDKPDGTGLTTVMLSLDS